MYLYSPQPSAELALARNACNTKSRRRSDHVMMFDSEASWKRSMPIFNLVRRPDSLIRKRRVSLIVGDTPQGGRTDQAAKPMGSSGEVMCCLYHILIR